MCTGCQNAADHTLDLTCCRAAAPATTLLVQLDRYILSETQIDSAAPAGNGFCVSQAKARVQNWLCVDTGLHPDTCPKTEVACAALCTKDTDCTGFM